MSSRLYVKILNPLYRTKWYTKFTGLLNNYSLLCYWCGHPTFKGKDHKQCVIARDRFLEQERVEEQQRVDAEEAYWWLMYSFCTYQDGEVHCFNEATDLDTCNEHAPCDFCHEYPCSCQDDEQIGADRDDDNHEECPGECGQPAYACTCAELASLRRHNADPNTRGSYWVA